MSSIEEIFDFARLMRKNREPGNSNTNNGSDIDTVTVTDSSNNSDTVTTSSSDSSSDSDEDLDMSRVELEFRLKRVNKRRFLRCLDYVRSWYPEIQSYSYKENRIQIVGNGSSVFRRIVRENHATEMVVKTTIRRSGLNDLWSTLLVSTETDTRSMQRDHKKATAKSRISFDVETHARIDFT